MKDRICGNPHCILFELYVIFLEKKNNTQINKDNTKTKLITNI